MCLCTVVYVHLTITLPIVCKYKFLAFQSSNYYAISNIATLIKNDIILVHCNFDCFACDSIYVYVLLFCNNYSSAMFKMFLSVLDCL